MSTIAQLALREKAIRFLEEKYEEERNSLIAFIKLYFKEELNKEFDDNWHYYVIEEKLKEVIDGKCTRLIVNVPPGSGKTLMITKFFPVWYMGKKQDTQIISTGYSASLAQGFGAEARDVYRSETFRKVFPRCSDIRNDQDTKGLWKNETGGQYLATGVGGSITGNRANLFTIDDPIKPDDAESDIKRMGVNNWYDNTVLSRLFSPINDAVIIIMQRTHENDLCGYLMEREEQGLGEKWDKIILPAIAEQLENYGQFRREEGEPLQKNRYPLESLEKLKLSLNTNFSCQYQQNPINKENQEFHEERFRYYNVIPQGARIFTTVDPAFSKKQTADDSCIMTGAFVGDEMYILEYTAGKYDPGELIDKIIYHIQKYQPEKVGIESFQAQTILGFNLKNALEKKGLYVHVEEIRQMADKLAKIRKLTPLYRYGLIYHKIGMDKLEDQLKKFPRGAHDDIIDAEQMLYDIYSIQPNVQRNSLDVTIEYDQFGRPTIV